MGKEEWKGRKGRKEGKRCEAPKNAENRNCYLILYLRGAIVPNPY